jgi:uncharacterized protein (DUF1330 family)
MERPVPAYLVAFCRGVNDRRGLEAYWANVAPSFEGTGAKPLAAYTTFEQLEGPGPIEGVVIVEFPSTEIAKRWYASPAYQDVKRYRDGAAVFDLVLADGGSIPAAARMPHIR